MLDTMHIDTEASTTSTGPHPSTSVSPNDQSFSSTGEVAMMSNCHSQDKQGAGIKRKFSEITSEESGRGEYSDGGGGSVSEESGNGGESDEVEETDDENERQFFWDCCHCTFKTENDLNRKYCRGCRHRRCKAYCMAYQEHVSDSDDEEGEDVLEDSEGAKVANIPPKKCLQEGPEHTGWELVLFKPKARKFLREVPLECMIPIYMASTTVFDKPRTIRAVWNHELKSWTFRSWERVNKTPWAWTFSEGLLQPEIRKRKIYHDAPPVGQDNYQFFNYANDTLYLYYGRCGKGNDFVEQEKMVDAMKIAADRLNEHQLKPETPKLRFLRITYCPFDTDVQNFIDPFKEIKTLEQVTLRWHDHYALNDTYYLTDWWAVHLAIYNGGLEDYPWKVVMENHTGLTLTEREGPFAEEEADDE